MKRQLHQKLQSFLTLDNSSNQQNVPPNIQNFVNKQIKTRKFLSNSTISKYSTIEQIDFRAKQKLNDNKSYSTIKKFDKMDQSLFKNELLRHKLMIQNSNIKSQSSKNNNLELPRLSKYGLYSFQKPSKQSQKNRSLQRLRRIIKASPNICNSQAKQLKRFI